MWEHRIAAACSLGAFNTVTGLKPEGNIKFSCSDPLHDDTGTLNSPNAGTRVCLALLFYNNF